MAMVVATEVVIVTADRGEEVGKVLVTQEVGEVVSEVEEGGPTIEGAPMEEVIVRVEEPAILGGETLPLS